MADARHMQLLIAALALLLPMIVSAPVFAQAGIGEDREIEEREERQGAMSERTYRRLSVIHELMGNQKYAEALDKLRTLEKSRLEPYEEALLFQTYGFVYASQDDYPRSIQYFERAVGMDALPNVAQQGMLYSLASLYATQDRYQDTIDTLVRWFRFEKEPIPDAYILTASAYAELNQLLKALPYVQEAIRISDDPKESWYQLEMAIYFEQKQFTQAARVLRIVISKWPDKLRYWEMLSGVYQELRQDKNALAALMLAYHKGLMEEEKKILNVVRMNLFLEVPFEAGKVMANAMRSGKVTRNKKNLELLLSAWTSAREFDKAIAVIDEISPMVDTGEFFVQKAQLFMEKNQWAEVVAACDQALDKGGLKKPGSMYLMKGIALAELDRFQAAINALRQAQKYDKSSRQQATGWIEFVRDRMASRSA